MVDGPDGGVGGEQFDGCGSGLAAAGVGQVLVVGLAVAYGGFVSVGCDDGALVAHGHVVVCCCDGHVCLPWVVRWLMGTDQRRREGSRNLERPQRSEDERCCGVLSGGAGSPSFNRRTIGRQVHRGVSTPGPSTHRPRPARGIAYGLTPDGIRFDHQ